MNRFALVNGKVLVDGEFRNGRSVVISAGTIEAIVEEGDSKLDSCEKIDLAGGRLCPGFIDIQVNGGGDLMFTADPTARTIAKIGEAHARFGVTGFLPTLISTDEDTMAAGVSAVREAMAVGVPGVLGIHFEGPLLASEKRGVHKREMLRRADDRLLETICSLRDGVTIVTVAPETIDHAAIRRLHARGVRVCIGHSAASYQQTVEALAAGCSGFTHLFNAMSQLGSREPGVVGAALSNPDSFVGLIADGVHVHPATLKIALALKMDKCFLVSDAMPPVGGAEDGFDLQGERIRCTGVECRNREGRLAGSCLDIATAVRYCWRRLGLRLADACEMASTNPAKFLGLESRLGSLRPGAAANLVVLDSEVEVRRTWSRGLERNLSVAGSS